MVSRLRCKFPLIDVQQDGTIFCIASTLGKLELCPKTVKKGGFSPQCLIDVPEKKQ